MNDIDLLVGEMLGPSGVVLRGMGQELDDFVAGLGQLSGWPTYEVAFTDSEELVAAGERVLGSLDEPVSAVFLLLPLERKGVKRGQMLEVAARIAAAMPAPSQLVVMLHAPEVGSLTPGSYEEGQLFGSHLSAVVNVDPSRGRQQYFHASVRLCLVRLTSEPVAEVVFVDQEGRSWDKTVEAWRSLREGKTSEAGFVGDVSLADVMRLGVGALA